MLINIGHVSAITVLIQIFHFNEKRETWCFEVLLSCLLFYLNNTITWVWETTKQCLYDIGYVIYRDGILKKIPISS